MKFKSEAQMQGYITKRIRKGDLKLESGAYELKLVRKGGLQFSKVSEHQEMALYGAKHGIMSHKLSDSALGFLPCDMLVVSRGKGELVVCFNESERIYFLDIDCWLKFKEGKLRGSMLEKEICQKAKLTLQIGKE